MREPTALRDALGTALGVSAVVSKARRLFLFENVRIHLDRVDGLGSFIEFEAVATDGEDPHSFAALLIDLQRSFCIHDEDLLSESYSDLLRSAARD